MERFSMLLLALTVIFIGLTYVIHIISKKVRIIKYFPGIICAILAGYYFYVVRQPHMGLEGIALAILMVVLAWISLVNFVTGVFIDFLLPIFRKNK